SQGRRTFGPGGLPLPGMQCCHMTRGRRRRTSQRRMAGNRVPRVRRVPPHAACPRAGGQSMLLADVGRTTGVMPSPRLLTKYSAAADLALRVFDLAVVVASALVAYRILY